jgi:hypothetical protein
MEERRDGLMRMDGTLKGPGFFGRIDRPDGDYSTELSIGVEFDGKEVQIPTLVPTLTPGEVDFLINGNDPTPEIFEKAVKHAIDRKKGGLSPFYEEGE